MDNYIEEGGICMIEEKAFLKLCETNGIMAFKVTTELDETDDLLLSHGTKYEL